MKLGTLSILLVAGAMFAGAASAQDAPAPSTPPLPPTPYVTNASSGQTNWDGDTWRHSDFGFSRTSSFAAGLDALDDRNFTKAEAAFVKAVQRNPYSAEANFYLGATRMDLGKWEDAKQNLEIAVKKISKHPDPKSRLGVTYAMLGDTAGAYAQRDALVKMAEDCNARCKLSPYIAQGIQMIDKALGKVPAYTPGTLPAA